MSPHAVFDRRVRQLSLFTVPLREAESAWLSGIEREARELLESSTANRESREESRGRLDGARAIAHLIADAAGERAICCAIGMLALEGGRWPSAVEAFETVFRLSTDRRDQALALLGKARALRETDPPAASLSCCAAALRRARWGARGLLISRIRLLVAEGYLLTGDLRRARRCLDRLGEIAGPQGQRWLRASFLRAEAELLRAQCRHGAAEALFKEAIEVVRTAEGPCVPGGATRTSLLRLLARCLLDQGRREEAGQRIEEALAAADGTDPLERRRVEFQGAMLRYADGDEENGDAILRDVERGLRELRSHGDLAELLLSQGEICVLRAQAPEVRSRAREGILEARGLFRRLDRRRQIHRCDILLESLRPPSCDVQRGLESFANKPPRVPRVRRLSQLGFLTADPRILRALEPLESLAHTSIPILVLGESGTGKEVLARALHRASGGKGPFVAVNCGALPSELQESELFGHVRGAFTGAVADKIGLFEAADTGSLLLDEVGEMTPRAQVKLLRVLELGEIRRVGETRIRRVRARVIAATNADLDAQVRTGAFRRDLYYRLCGLKIELPPLRERLGDVPLLASHFVDLFGNHDGPPPTLSSGALDRLLQHTWPGNVRELRFTVEKAVALTKALSRSSVEADCIDIEAPVDPAPIPAPMPARERAEGAEGLGCYMENMERRLILKALEENKWNRTRAARSLGGMSRTTLIGKMKRLGLFPGPGRGDPDCGEAESPGERAQACAETGAA
ncbi:MAG: AAA family ATPase [Candidatus Eisenbacteria bacterium]|nr:AAA family ATPase [Candidatus Eisenbacteria bacterium]